MSELETRQVLLFVCETLKTHTTYLTGLHRTVVELYESLLQHVPELEKTHKEEMEKIREFPASQRLLRNLDALIQQLANP